MSKISFVKVQIFFSYLFPKCFRAKFCEILTSGSSFAFNRNALTYNACAAFKRPCA